MSPVFNYDDLVHAQFSPVCLFSFHRFILSLPPTFMSLFQKFETVFSWYYVWELQNNLNSALASSCNCSWSRQRRGLENDQYSSCPSCMCLKYKLPSSSSSKPSTVGSAGLPSFSHVHFRLSSLHFKFFVFNYLRQDAWWIILICELAYWISNVLRMYICQFFMGHHHLIHP